MKTSSQTYGLKSVSRPMRLVASILFNKATTFLGRFMCYWVGARLGSGGRFFGLPWIRVEGRNASVTIGMRFRACSERGYNAIGVNQRVMLRTCADDARLVIGDDVGMSGCTISATKSIQIGNRVLIGSGVLITDSDHHALSPEARQRGEQGKSLPIVIGDDVFIGARAIILKGVSIGDGSVVGAGSVVTRSIPPRTIVAGNPAREIGVVA